MVECIQKTLWNTRMLNLYKYHTKPDKLNQYDNRNTIVPELAFDYANETYQCFEAGERAIMKSSFYAYLYAENIIEGRWEAGEPAIIKDPKYAYQYANYIIKGRWLEAEQVIMKDKWYAYLYARDIIKGRWEAGETAIMKDPCWWNIYKKQFGVK